MTRPQIFYGWWIVVSAALVSVWGGALVYCATVFIDPIVNEFQWTYVMVAAALSIRTAEFGLLAPVAGHLTDRFGPRVVVITGALLAGLGCFLLGFTDSLGWFYAAFIVMSVGISGMGQAVVTTVVSRWFHRKMGRALGLVIAGYGAGGALVPLAAWLVNVIGWRYTIDILGGVTLALVIPLALLLRPNPENYGMVPDGPAKKEPVGAVAKASTAPADPPEATVRQALSTASFWLLGIAFLVQFMALNCITVFSVPYLDSVGLPTATAAVIAMCIPFVSVVGRLGVGWLIDALGSRKVLAALMLLQGLGILFYLWGREPWHFVVFLVLYAPASGAGFTLRPVAIRELYGRSRLGALQGLMIAIAQLGGMLGPVLVGWLRDTQGVYTTAWLWLAVLCIVGTALGWFGLRPRRAAQAGAD
jgi:MFS family permease